MCMMVAAGLAGNSLTEKCPCVNVGKGLRMQS